MGAGQGKTRRTRTGNEPGLRAGDLFIVSGRSKPLLTVDDKKWAQFVAESGLEKTKIYSYYLGAAKKNFDDADHAQVVTESFRDAAAVGAVSFPGKYGRSE